MQHNDAQLFMTICLTCEKDDPLLERLIRENVYSQMQVPLSSNPSGKPKAATNGATKADMVAKAKNRGFEKTGSATAYDSNYHYCNVPSSVIRPVSCNKLTYPCMAFMRGDPCPADGWGLCVWCRLLS
jgi:hypothetical protein